mgnify:CR=1 FL=1
MYLKYKKLRVTGSQEINPDIDALMRRYTWLVLSEIWYQDNDWHSYIKIESWDVPVIKELIKKEASEWWFEEATSTDVETAVNARLTDLWLDTVTVGTQAEKDADDSRPTMSYKKAHLYDVDDDNQDIDSVDETEYTFTAGWRATLRNGRWQWPNSSRGIFYDLSTNYWTSTQPNPNYKFAGRTAPYDLTIKKVFLSWNYDKNIDVSFKVQFVRQTSTSWTSVSNALVWPEAQYTITGAWIYNKAHLDTVDSGVWDDIADITVNKWQKIAPLIRRTTSNGSSNLYLLGFTRTILYTIN